MHGTHSRAALLAAIIATALLTPALGWAAPGDGLRTGNLELKPGILLGGGFDSNVYFQSRGRGSIREAYTGIVEPRLKITTVEPNSVDFTANAAVSWTQFFHSTETVRDQSGLATSLGATATINPRGSVSLRLREEFTRTNESPSDVSPQTLNRIANRAGARIGFHPGGRVLESYLGYDFYIHRYNIFSDLDHNIHQFGWENMWRFLPKTALVIEADYRMIQYLEEFLTGQNTIAPGSRLANVNSSPLRLMGGISGLLTNRLNVRLMGGYGWSFHEEGPTFSGILGRAEASYHFGNVSMNNRLRVGYEHGFADSALGNFFTMHRVRAGYEQGVVNGRLRLALDADMVIREYSALGITEVERTDPAMRRLVWPDQLNDLVVSVSPAITFNFTNWWSAGLNYRFVANFTDDEILVDAPTDVIVREYIRHHVMLNTTVTY